MLGLVAPLRFDDGDAPGALDALHRNGGPDARDRRASQRHQLARRVARRLLGRSGEPEVSATVLAGVRVGGDVRPRSQGISGPARARPTRSPSSCERRSATRPSRRPPRWRRDVRRGGARLPARRARAGPRSAGRHVMTELSHRHRHVPLHRHRGLHPALGGALRTTMRRRARTARRAPPARRRSERRSRREDDRRRCPRRVRRRCPRCAFGRRARSERSRTRPGHRCPIRCACAWGCTPVPPSSAPATTTACGEPRRRGS